ncbi:hypothetical protein CPter291_0913 [Collimonas pratensis]|uniref:Uncharacterized protein n=1 Tax=Collimonas pratensis TaxID=279113 RepID=A0ABN4MCC2_9BURK|nr:hypothetical protein CPter291_0913 [Collimonas pratensis]
MLRSKHFFHNVKQYFKEKSPFTYENRTRENILIISFLKEKFILR